MATSELFRTGIKICEACIGISSNAAEFLPVVPGPLEVNSLLTDFYAVDEIEYADNLDGYIEIQEDERPVAWSFSPDVFSIRGPLARLSHEASDRRYSLWGNLGLLYRFVLYLLEKKHRIYNLHACSLYSPHKDTLFVVIGGAGSGKTVYLLKGLELGLQLFSTETVHFRLEGGRSTWFIGSLADNVRFGTLMYDFPGFLPDVPPPAPDEAWRTKIALDLSPYRTTFDKITDPGAVILILPHIEKGISHFQKQRMPVFGSASTRIFDNISQKLAETFLIYDHIAVTGFDRPSQAAERRRVVERLVKSPRITGIYSILSNPKDCWGDLLNI